MDRFSLLLDSLKDYSAGIQAFASIITAFLTGILIWATIRYVRITQELLRVQRLDSILRLKPSLDIECVRRDIAEPRAVDGNGYLEWLVRNRSPNDAIIKFAAATAHCTKSEGSVQLLKALPQFSEP